MGTVYEHKCNICGAHIHSSVDPDWTEWLAEIDYFENNHCCKCYNPEKAISHSANCKQNLVA
jgi:hypothetical protein